MTDSELEALLAGGESERAERKRNVSDKDRIRQAICAFANDLPGSGRPGVIFIGVEDNGDCANQAIGDALLLELSQMRDDGKITPFPSLAVERRRLRNCDVAVAVVRPSHNLPVRLDGRVWIRVGPRRALATPEEERHLLERQRGHDLPFDAREAASATIQDDLDSAYVRDEYLPSAIAPDVLAENQRPIEQQLRSVHFVGRHALPTHVGLIVAGIDAPRNLPGAYVQCCRFEGRDLADPIRDSRDISGRIADVLRRAEEWMQAQNAVAVFFVEREREQRMPEYPSVALQQLFRNAVMHRNYDGTSEPVRVYWFDDRIEISNPGGPYGQVTQANFGTGVNDYRNPTLAEAMKNLGFVQRFGVGIATAQKALRENGNPEAEFEVQPSRVLAVLRRHR